MLISRPTHWVSINDSWFVIYESNLKFHKQMFFKKQKITNHSYFTSSNLYKNTPVYGLLRNKNQISLVHQNGSTLDSLQGEELQLLQVPAAFITPFFHESLLKS